MTGVPEFEVNRVQIRKHFEAQNSAERLAYKELEVSIDGFFLFCVNIIVGYNDSALRLIMIISRNDCNHNENCDRF